MSGAPGHPESELPEPEALAAEHALGVLSARDRAAAEARMAADPEFAEAVEAWAARLAPLQDDTAPVTPDLAVWPRIARALPANDDGRLGRAVRLWRGSALGAMALAAASLAAVAVVANRPPVVITHPAVPAGPLLNASLRGEAGPPMFVVAYDPDRKALIITSLAPPGADPAHAHQLWLIPADGKPRSLGIVEPGTSRRMTMAGPLAPMVSEGAALAVSVEPPGGSRQAGPSGPLAATGKLSKI
jgi:anti-sigma-K factor RskA